MTQKAESLETANWQLQFLSVKALVRSLYDDSPRLGDQSKTDVHAAACLDQVCEHQINTDTACGKTMFATRMFR